MQRYTLTLSDPQADLETAGGKGMSLARMLNAGLPVPGGFHLTTHAYRRFVADNGLQTRILDALSAVDPAHPDALEATSRTIRQSFMEGHIPAEIVEAISMAYSTLKNVPVAVRSSATAEDLPGASFAGQQETYLNIRSLDAVLEAVQKCWASLWTGRAIAYRIKNGIDQATVALAVVVQELVFADAAGILFTANPINGHRDELLINAAWGLGEAAVAGAVTPDTITVDKNTGRILQREIAAKEVMTIRTPDGTHEVPVPAAQKKKAALSRPQTAELARLGVKIEQFYGMPMDVEWALAGGQFSVLQARPITAMPPDWKVPESRAIYARGSLAEHIPSPVTPLFATLGLELANAATAQLWERVLGQDANQLVSEDGYYLPLNGYVYGGMRMGVKELFISIKMTIAQFGPFIHDSVGRWRAARQKFAAVVDTWEQKSIAECSSSQLLEGVRVVFGAACQYFTDIQTTLPAASVSESIFSRVYEGLMRRKGDPQAAVFLLGRESIALRGEKSLFALGTWIKTDAALENYILNTPAAALITDLRQEEPPQGVSADGMHEWRLRFQAHLHEFGRTTYEFDFSNPTPLEAPGPLLDALKGFLAGRVQNPYERQRQALEKQQAAAQAVIRRVGWPRRGWFEKLLHWAQENAPMREDSIFDMGMGHPLIRRMFAELGRRLVACGSLERGEEIYWLEKTELEAMVSAQQAGKPLPNITEQIVQRKAQWQSALKVSPPVLLPEKSGWSKLVHGNESRREDGKVVLKGVGTSAGKITAPACVLYGPQDFGTMKAGDVLVAVTTTPAWTALFSLASAVVTDIGGPLSHSSIVAREYGIPAVMAARTATRAIHNGQRITVDGAAGTVTLE